MIKKSKKSKLMEEKIIYNYILMILALILIGNINLIKKIFINYQFKWKIH